MVNFRAIEVTFPINFKRLKPRKMKIYLKIKTLQSSFSFFQKLILSSFNLMAFITKDDRRQSSRANEGLPSLLDSQDSNTSDDRRILSFQTDSKNSSYPLKSPPMLISRVLERTITPWTTNPPHWTTPSNPRKVPRGYNTHRIRCSQKTEEILLEWDDADRRGDRHNWKTSSRVPNTTSNCFQPTYNADSSLKKLSKSSSPCSPLLFNVWTNPLNLKIFKRKKY